MDENIRILEQKYCPPLDPALVHAIYSDFSEQPDGIQQARELLDGLKQTAAAEQLTDFDPSGSSGDAVRSSPSKQGSDDVESNAETSTSLTTATDYTSLSNDIATLGLGETGSGSEVSSDGGYFKVTEHFDTLTKELLLAETFPTLRLELIAYTLKKCDDDFSKATDELLNHVYFEDSRSSPTEEVAVAKGIDAFSEAYHVPQRGKKGKKRKQKSMPLYDSSPASVSESDLCPTPPVNRWADGGRDVEFIASRTKISSKAVASLYHKNGASLAPTILALLKEDIALHAKEQEPDATVIQPALDLTEDFPNIDLEYAVALVRLTAPSTANAHELAKALTVYPGSTSTPTGGLKIIPRYAPVNLSDPTPETTILPDLPAAATSRNTASLAAARNDAFSKASAAYRKGKSNPLMRGAAGYYSQEGRDLHANYRAMTKADADALVLSQSSTTYLDLHGVNVQNATRIALAKTQSWWDSLGEARIPGGGRGGVGEGYRIITGLGRHSEGGRGKLGPAVGRALVREGWKVEVGSGEMVVLGVARRR